MKKYIKYFSKNIKRQIRVDADNNIAITAKLHSDRMEVTFSDKTTGETRFILALYAMDKNIENLCQNMIDCHLSFLVESYVQLMAVEDYRSFLSSDCRTFSINKYGKNWNFRFNLFMKIIHDEEGKEIKNLATDYKKFVTI